MRVVGRWWNGTWGRARKDIGIEVHSDGSVVLWFRDVDGERRRPAATVDAARSAAAMLRQHGDPYDRWVDWTGLYVRDDPAS